MNTVRQTSGPPRFLNAVPCDSHSVIQNQTIATTGMVLDRLKCSVPRGPFHPPQHNMSLLTRASVLVRRAGAARSVCHASPPHSPDHHHTIPYHCDECPRGATCCACVGGLRHHETLEIQFLLLHPRDEIEPIYHAHYFIKVVSCHMSCNFLSWSLRNLSC